MNNLIMIAGGMIFCLQLTKSKTNILMRIVNSLFALAMILLGVIM